ncbi:unnamed protein product [Rhizophagus irregularis]|uniref:Tc1-like transposase DDE domain-containing protein n=1 Tax=Rhizophagus irregularis TaxID=588596 RepID=A0A916E5V8_9GLOM|nr:unnamed protein product [Rhizophagus irregularis]
MNILRGIVQTNADLYLGEIAQEMEVQSGKHVSIPTLWRSLAYCGITRKKLHKIAKEHGIIAVDIMEGGCTKEKFKEFVISQVLPQMNSYPQARSVLILDNARIHHDDGLLEYLDAFGLFEKI